ncbi:hypothetical protein [Deferribacter abyssi]|uniref:hypothetical protein n=1 Tax=Deferribacter abyssi TaxID=213806 RepID=UPI003C2080AB
MKKMLLSIILLLTLAVEISFAESELGFLLTESIKSSLKNSLSYKVVGVTKRKKILKISLSNYDVITINDNVIVLSRDYNFLSKDILMSTDTLKYLKTKDKLIIQVIEVRK